MDEDVIALCVFAGLLIAFPLSVVLITTSCIAYARTKKWDKERTLKAANLESETNNLLDTDEDDEFLDTDDESDHKAEEEQDKFLTFGQMWRKELKKAWTGKGAKQMIKEREREERRKLAKAVARELDRRERRKAKKAKKEAEDTETLPPYYKN
jgi:biopolymer transport protein ExbB/TolQ